MDKIKDFFKRHKGGIVRGIISAIIGGVAALAVIAATLFGYYGIQPQEAVNIEIRQAVIQGTVHEDGSEIQGFIIVTEDGTEYLVTDYWEPIALTDSIPE